MAKRTDFHKITISDEFKHPWDAPTSCLALDWDSDKPKKVMATFGSQYADGPYELEPLDLLRLKNFLDDFGAMIKSAKEDLEGKK